MKGWANIRGGIDMTRGLGLFRAAIITVCVAIGAARADLKTVLIYSMTAGFRHTQGIPDGNHLIDSLGKAHGFTVTVTENPDSMKYDIMKKFNVVVFNNTTGAVLPLATQQNDFIKYLTEGGGWVGFHGAMDHKGYWPWYTDLGVDFNGHTPGIADINIDTGAGAKKPEYAELLATIPKVTFQWREEWYTFKENPRRNSDILVTADEKTPGWNPSNPMGDHAVAWAKTLPKLPGFARGGRYFYTSLGHGGYGLNGTHCFKNEQYVNEFVYQALRFAAYPAGPVSVKASKVLPTFRTDAVSQSASQVDVAVGEDGPHAVQILDMRGRKVDGANGNGPSSYVFSRLNRQSIYVVKISAAGHDVSRRVFVQ